MAKDRNGSRKTGLNGASVTLKIRVNSDDTPDWLKKLCFGKPFKTGVLTESSPQKRKLTRFIATKGHKFD